MCYSYNGILYASLNMAVREKGVLLVAEQPTFFSVFPQTLSTQSQI
jgi:hypothetical protein